MRRWILGLVAIAAGCTPPVEPSGPAPVVGSSGAPIPSCPNIQPGVPSIDQERTSS